VAVSFQAYDTPSVFCGAAPKIPREVPESLWRYLLGEVKSNVVVLLSRVLVSMRLSIEMATSSG
jgi:hypothetical protein